MSFEEQNNTDLPSPPSLRPLEALNTDQNVAKLLTKISRHQKGQERIDSLTLLWNMSNNRQVAEQICAAGHRDLLEILRERPSFENQQIQGLALRTLVNLSIPDGNKNILVPSIPIMIEMLKLRNDDIREQVTEFLGELAFHGPATIDQIQEHGGFEYFVDVARGNTIVHQLTGLRAIWHASIFKDRHRNAFAKNTGLQRVIQLYKDAPDDEVRQVAFDTLEAMAQSAMCRQFLMTEGIRWEQKRH